MLRNIILPLVTLISGLVCLYIDPKRDKSWAWAVILALTASAVFSGVYGYVDDKSHNTEVADAKQNTTNLISISKTALDEQKKMDGEVEKLEASNASMATDLHTLMRRQNIPLSEGDVTSQAAPTETKAAQAIPPIIEYFAKDTEGDGVTKVLRDSGLDVIKLPGQIPGPTNSIWAGESVNVSEVKPVALALLRAGVQLRAVGHFANGSGPKAHLIEIGSDRAIQNSPVLTADQIQSMNSLPTR